MSIKKIADDIMALKLHPATSEEYDSGYQAARYYAWLVAQEAIELLSEQIASLIGKAPPDFADKSQHVEWGGDVFVWLEEQAKATA